MVWGRPPRAQKVNNRTKLLRRNLMETTAMQNQMLEGKGGAPLASKRQERQSGHPWNNRYRRTTRLGPDFKITAVLAGLGLPGVGSPTKGPKSQ